VVKWRGSGRGACLVGVLGFHVMQTNESRFKDTGYFFFEAIAKASTRCRTAFF